MQIAIDIGNTRTKLAIRNGNSLLKPIVVLGEPEQKLLELLQAEHLEHGIISSVSGSGDAWKAQLPRVQWLVLDQKTPLPFINKYATPQTLGLDRVALAAAAVNAFPQKNTLVIDAGTCVTYDFVDETKAYLGGSISPGLTMRTKAMSSFTARLPLVEVKSNVELIGDSTERSLQSGALYGLTAEMEGIINRYQEQFADLHIVLTGGDAKTLAPLIKSNIFARPNFLLEGLHGILAFNAP